MPLTDKALVIATDIDVTADANGAAVTCGLTGTLGPINNGNVCMAHMRFDGDIETDSGDEVLDVYIEGYDGTTYYSLGVFPRISYDTATKFNASNMASGLGVVSIPIVIPLWVTQLRYRADVTGTVVTGWNDMNIWLVPTNFIPASV